MTDLRLQPALARGPNDYEVIAEDWIVGRIVLSDASPAERPWLRGVPLAKAGERNPDVICERVLKNIRGPDIERAVRPPKRRLELRSAPVGESFRNKLVMDKLPGFGG